LRPINPKLIPTLLDQIYQFDLDCGSGGREGGKDEGRMREGCWVEGLFFLPSGVGWEIAQFLELLHICRIPLPARIHPVTFICVPSEMADVMQTRAVTLQSLGLIAYRAST